MDRGSPIARLENELRELTKEWERFFAGVIRVPPEKARIAFGKRMRRLTEAGGVGATDQYRLQQLQHKFSSYSQMWERMLREREEGRGRSLAHLRAASRAAAQQERRPSSSKPDAAAARSVDNDRSGDLYDEFMKAKEKLGQDSSIKREAFLAQLDSQRQQIESRLGHAVRFEVHIEGDKVKLTARKKGGAGQE